LNEFQFSKPFFFTVVQLTRNMQEQLNQQKNEIRDLKEEVHRLKTKQKLVKKRNKILKRTVQFVNVISRRRLLHIVTTDSDDSE
jgi:uncharacterized protein YllA (UPF0747 family)